jgi:hemerythrin-like metal-binding protein
MIIWTEQFATGTPLVDTHHKMLIEKINLLEALLDGPTPPKEDYDEVIIFLRDYVATHFVFEEHCMERAHCPAYEKNLNAHTAFLKMFAHFEAHYHVEGPKPALLRNLHHTANDWIMHHILSIDTQLKMCNKD